MKFSVQDGPFTYMVDWSQNDRIEGGWLEEYHASISEMLDAVIQLLECVYPVKEIKEEIKKYAEKEC